MAGGDGAAARRGDARGNAGRSSSAKMRRRQANVILAALGSRWFPFLGQPGKFLRLHLRSRLQESRARRRRPRTGGDGRPRSTGLQQRQTGVLRRPPVAQPALLSLRSHRRRRPHRPSCLPGGRPPGRPVAQPALLCVQKQNSPRGLGETTDCLRPRRGSLAETLERGPSRLQVR